MGSIPSNKITLAFLCVILLALGLFLGFRWWPFLFPAAGALVGYLFIDRKYLRCPSCGGFLNLDTLFYAKKHPCYCRHCGKAILVKD